MILQIVGGSMASLAVVFGIVWLATRNSSSSSHSSADASRGTTAVSVVPNAAPGSLDVIPPERAGSYFEKNCTVEFTVRKTGRATTAVRFFLNSKTDLSAPDNFTVTFTGEVFDQFRMKGMTELDSYFISKTIRVSGKVTKYAGRMQMEIRDANQIQFVGSR
jgi:hypothetical protein